MKHCDMAMDTMTEAGMDSELFGGGAKIHDAAPSLITVCKCEAPPLTPRRRDTEDRWFRR